MQSLRKLTTPFTLLVHPDRTTTHSLSSSSQSTNLQALQTLNGLLDTIEHLYNRAHFPSSSSSSVNKKGRVELQTHYRIEFVVTRTNSIQKLQKKDGLQKEIISTVKSVDLSFPDKIRNGVQLVDANGMFVKEYATALKQWSVQELFKLLRVAGLPVPNVEELDQSVTKEEYEGEERKFGGADLFWQDLDLDSDTTTTTNNNTSSSHYTRRFEQMQHPSSTRRKKRKLTKWEQSKKEFMSKINWKSFQKAYDLALADAQADVLTKGYIANHPQRKRDFVSGVISRVRIMDTTAAAATTKTATAATTAANEIKEGKIEKEEDGMDEERKEELGLDTLHQLIAIRRLSLILYDSFDELEMEQMGRLWEQTTLILTPERQVLKEQQQQQQQQQDDELTIQKRRNKKKGTKSKDSGFKFALGSNDEITIYVPIDFKDEEIVNELSVYMWDLYNMRMSQRDGFGLDIDDLMPIMRNAVR